MKKLLLLLTCCSLLAEEPEIFKVKKDGGDTIIRVAPTITVETQSDVDSNVSNGSSSGSALSSVSDQVVGVTSSIYNSLEAMLISIKQGVEAGSESLWNNKGKVILGASAALYGYLLYETRSMQSYLTDSDAWSAWRSELSLEKIYAIPDTDIIADLLFSVQKRYSNVIDLDNYIEPVKKFFYDVKQERTALERYRRWGNIIKKLPLFFSKVFFMTAKFARSNPGTTTSRPSFLAFSRISFLVASDTAIIMPDLERLSSIFLENTLTKSSVMNCGHARTIRSCIVTTVLPV